MRTPEWVTQFGLHFKKHSPVGRWARKMFGRKPKPAPKPAPKPTPAPAPVPAPKPKPPAPVGKGCDYVSGPTPAQLKAAGMTFVCRYLSSGYENGDPNKPVNPKDLTAAEAAGLHKAGINIVLVFETTATRALAGKAAGKSDYVSARKQATALGCPTSVPIYFAVDFDMQPSEAGKVIAYFNGASSVDGAASVGVYGGIAAVEAVASSHVARWFWQAYAWSGGKWYAGNHLEQYENGAKIAGHSVDLDRSCHALYGAWKA